MSNDHRLDLLEQRFERLLSIVEALAPDGLELNLIFVQCKITDEQVQAIFDLLEATDVAARIGQPVRAVAFENAVGDIVSNGNAFGSPHALADLIVRALKSNGRFKHAADALIATHWLG